MRGSTPTAAAGSTPAGSCRARPSTGRVVRGQDEWLVAIPGLLPAYITVEAYRANRARLAANAARAETPGVVRAGSALLSGLARCGRCGRRMTVRYHVRGQTTKPSMSAPDSCRFGWLKITDKKLRQAVMDFAGDSRHANPWAAHLDNQARTPRTPPPPCRAHPGPSVAAGHLALLARRRGL
jgi:Recombinase zinc beta ribbon domain